MPEIFNTLYDVDVRDRMYDKEGNIYIPWATAWSEVKKRYPKATYEIKLFGESQLPYTESPLGLMVFTSVTIEDITHEMWMTVMDSKNKAMKSVPYKYKTKSGEKEVAAATMFDINRALMRCLTKNIAMFGLGLHLWTKEFAPESVMKLEKLRAECTELIRKKAALSEETKVKVKELCESMFAETNGDPRLCEDEGLLTEFKKKIQVMRKQGGTK